MEVFYIVLQAVLVIVLVLALGARPVHTTISRFELERRSKEGDKQARKLLERENLLRDIYSVQRVLSAVLLVVVSIIGLMAYHWAIAVIVALIVALEAPVVSQWSFVQRRSQKLYDRAEAPLLIFIKKFPGVVRLIRATSPPVEEITLNSKEELQHLVEKSEKVFTDDERKAILSSLAFSKKLVRDIMIPTSSMEVINDNEILGPLVLDDLHKKGHSRIPVIQKDLDHIIGILYVQNLLTIDGSKNPDKVTARVAMDKKVYYINENQTLDQALSAFSKTQHNLLIVVDKSRKTVGLITLEDITKALLGRKLTHNFDDDEDLKAVASRGVEQ
jgi:CBS domain containing-hemolysin-like protein